MWWRGGEIENVRGVKAEVHLTGRDMGECQIWEHAYIIHSNSSLISGSDQKPLYLAL